MLKKIAILTLILVQVLSLQAQKIKFGVHVDPFISLLDSNSPYVVGDAVNGGAALGVEVEYRLNDEGNYAITFGADFSINNGGSLLYRYGGVLFKNTDLTYESYQDIGGNKPSSGTNLDIAAFTKVNYRVNYVQIPIGLKLRTNELGGSYMRAFFHIPLVKIMIPVTGAAKVFTPGAVASSASGYTDDLTGYRIPSGNSEGAFVEPNIWKDITPLQIGLGAGAGVEFTPDQENGLRLYAGIYYETGVIDVTGGFTGETTFQEATTGSNAGSEVTKTLNPRNSAHTISLRIGVIF